MKLGLAGLVLASCAAQVAPPGSPSASPRAAQWYFDGVTQPAHRGGAAAVTIHGAPLATCTAAFLWPGMPSAGQRIPAITTDASGTGTFRWTVDPATPPGSWRIDATCGGETFSTHVPVD